MKLHLSYILLLAAALLSGTGCTNETMVSDGRLSGEDVATVTFRINTPRTTETRALSANGENAINQMDILVFDRSLKLVDYQHSMPLTLSGNLTTFQVDLKASQTFSDNYRLLFVANAHDFLMGFFNGDNVGGHKGESYGQVTALLNTGWDATTVYAANGMVMWGEYRDMQVISSSSHFPVLRMVRALSRIDVGTNPVLAFTAEGRAIWAKLDNFSLEDVYIYKTADRYSILPARNNFDFSAVKATGVTIPSSAAPLTPQRYYGSHVTRDGAAGIAIESEIYVPEADVLMSTGAKYDANHTNRPAIVVGGYYRDSPEKSYYRVDFINGQNMHDILRNHMYQVIITRVSGIGYGTPDDAYKALDTNVQATIVDWNQSVQNVIFDGTYRLTLSIDKIYVGNEGIQSPIVATITTDHPDGLTITPEVNGYDPLYPTPNYYTDWLSALAAKPSEYTGNDKMEITVSSVQPNTTRQVRSARFTIRAGNLEYEFYIEQSKDPWVTVTKDPLYILDGGVKNLKATSKYPWTAEIKAGTNAEGAIKSVITTKGGAKDNEPVLFSVYDGDGSTPVMRPQTVVVTFKDPTGVRKDVDVPVSLRVPVSYCIANGNIVLDENDPTRLKFADDATAQGLQFKWGSLIGMLSIGADKTAADGAFVGSRDVVFRPEELSSSIDTSTWEGVPYCTEAEYTPSTYDVNRYEFSEAYPADGTNPEAVRAAEGKGDICRYMTEKGWVPKGTRWRMMTVVDVGDLWRESEHFYQSPHYTNVENCYGYVVGDWTTSLAGAPYSPIYGDYPIGAGWYFGVKITSSDWTPESIGVDQTRPPKGLAFFPASGFRGTNARDSGAAGTNGTYWQSTLEPNLLFPFWLDIRHDYVGPVNTNWRGQGLPIRCVRF